MHILPQGFHGPEHIGDVAAFTYPEGTAMISGDVFDTAAGAKARFPA